ncbi:phage protease [Alishewanella sp. 16-MA]|uniref:Phage protease n=1 Tax=Alishewanella maricola TaxID=2795740 RepID=A0ABS8C1G4_9ALTE|nr:phage protease [Alishewanella maricola]MCB5226171.1 phage protease [Alishewanella maricola]
MFTPTTIALAVLTATANASLGLAVLSGELQTEDGWVQLLPDGEFASIDGRPHDVPGGKWKMSAQIAERLIQQAKLRANELVIDYEHQTLQAAENGKAAPAAGWFKDMEFRPGQGLFIKPVWLSAAKEHISNKEYRYLSAVFPYDPKTGEPLEIRMAALTNYPGLDGMKALAALTATTSPTPNRENAMNELLKKLLAKLGITVPDGMDPTEQNVNDALAALTAMSGNDKELATLKAEVAALKADTGNIDYEKFVPVAAYTALHQQLAQLKASNDVMTVDQVIKQAEEDGKLITQAERDYLQALGKQNIAALKATLDARPVLAALKGKQTTTAPVDVERKNVAVLTADQKLIADQLGMSYSDMAKELGA